MIKLHQLSQGSISYAWAAVAGKADNRLTRERLLCLNYRKLTLLLGFRWEEVPGMLEKRIGAVAVIVGEEVWVIGGGDGNGSASTEILELVANDPINWKWKSGPQLLNARYAHCSLLVNNRSEIVVIGGHSPDGIVGVVEVLDVTSGQVTTLAPEMPHLRWGSVCLPLDNGERIAVTGGMDNWFLPHKSVDVLDTVSWQWEEGEASTVEIT